MGEGRALLRGFVWAAKGIGYGIRTQRNLRIHLCALAVVIGFDIMAGFSLEHWCLELLCCMAVISLELFNTALEALCDRVSPEKHPLIGHAKDASAGAVLVSAIGSVIVGIALFFRGSPDYLIRTRQCLTRAGVQAGLAGFLLLAALFVFLPCYFQKNHKKEFL